MKDTVGLLESLDKVQHTCVIYRCSYILLYKPLKFKYMQQLFSCNLKYLKHHCLLYFPLSFR